MKYMISAILAMLVFSSLLNSIQAQSFAALKFTEETQKITIGVQLNPGSFKDSIKFEFTSFNYAGLRKWHSVKHKFFEGNATWRYITNEPVLLKIESLPGPYGFWFSEPDDSIAVRIDGSEVVFSGKGSEKFKLQHEIKLLRQNLKKPSNNLDTYTKSFDDYFEWHDYLNRYEELLISLIDSYKDRISSYAYNYIRDKSIDGIVGNRKDKFASLESYARARSNGTISNKDLCAIYDSTCRDKIFRWMPYASDGFVGEWSFIKLEIRRQYEFNYDKDPLNSELKRTLLYYEAGLEIYKNKKQSRENFLVWMLTEEMMHEIGITPEIENYLDKYYAELGFPEHKKYVKEYELRRRTSRLAKGYPAPDFKLTDIKGNSFTKRDLKNKVSMMSFWFTGCTDCGEMAVVLNKIENTFKNDTNVVFINISADKDREEWIKSIERKKYTTDSGINLYTGGSGNNHSIMRAYIISDYPGLYLMDAFGRVVENPLPDPRKDNGEQLSDLIREQLALINDGPYIRHKNNSVVVSSVNNTTVLRKEWKRNKLPALAVQTDEYKKLFKVTLKENLNKEPSEFAPPPAIFALSDIEGNFEAFRKLLQANNIIDKDYNWIFGQGHLVFCGDMFDRGEQVTECLWLVYSLEEKAKAADGYVHFILGNHEIMNLNGDTRYVKLKYAENAKRINSTYADLYGPDTELGRWLRTKNIMEKIGDILFVHGGISPQLNDLAVSIEQINGLARPWYDRDSLARRSPDELVALIFDTEGRLSPFWYRSYYLDQEVKVVYGGKYGLDTLYKTSKKEINRTLEKFKVSCIVTGHTIIDPGQAITMHYDGRVINMDTHHASGPDHSEALLVEKNNFFRTNQKGERKLLRR